MGIVYVKLKLYFCIKIRLNRNRATMCGTVAGGLKTI